MTSGKCCEFMPGASYHQATVSSCASITRAVSSLALQRLIYLSIYPPTYLHVHIHIHINVHVHRHTYIWCPPPHVPTFFVFFTSFTYLVGRLGAHSLVLVVYLMCCLLVLLVLCEMGEHYLVLIRGPAGIGSNRRVLDPIATWIEDRRLKMHGKVSAASSIFDLRSRPVLDPTRGYWIQYRSGSKIED